MFTPTDIMVFQIAVRGGRGGEGGAESPQWWGSEILLGGGFFYQVKGT